MTRTGNLLTNYAILPMPRFDEFLSTSFINNNLSYFNRLFKKEYQMSPRAYRNR